MATKKTAKSNSKFDYKTIKTFENACEKLNINPNYLPEVSTIGEFGKSIIAAYKLMIIFKAINNGWIPDWNNRNEYKYYPWFEVLSSGFGFGSSHYDCVNVDTSCGSRLCTDTSDKALYIAEQFKAEYQEYFLYSK
ncbi:MAG: hypothetical protein PHW73_01160 [Atribacterota bacterium]|nr:hypothetical protein [Atribacterota bacterium]